MPATSSEPALMPVKTTQPDPLNALSERLRDAQATAVIELLAEARTSEQLIAVAENAAGFAEASTIKHLHPQSPPVACAPGCSWCCYQLIPVSVPETARIHAFVQGLPDEQRSGIATRLRALDKVTRGLTIQQRVSIPKPCAYLEDGKCSVHPVRPLACAEFTSYDVQVCKRGKRLGFKPDSVMHEKARMLAYYAVERGLFDGLAEALPQSDRHPLELTAASVVAMNHADAPMQWLEGEDVFKSARLRTSSK